MELLSISDFCDIIVQMKYYLLLVTIILLLITSCSNANEEFYEISYTDTLKALTEERSVDMDWTEEIDAYILEKGEEKFNNNKFLRRDKKNQKPSILLPEGLFLGINQKKEKPVYPEIKNFASLDLRKLTKNEYNVVETFLKNLMDHKVDKNVFLTDYNFQAKILEYEISDWKKIISWIIGAPYKGEVQISNEETYMYVEVPVRIYFESSFIDMDINLVDENAKLFIEQIRISKEKEK